MNQVKKSTYKLLSAVDIPLDRYYKVARKFVDLTHPSLLFYKSENYKIPGEDHLIPVELFYPAKEGEYPLILFFHGGGWVTGTMQSYQRICATMARELQHYVMAVDYRLAPEYPFPCGLMDCYHVTKAVYLHPELFNQSQNSIIIMGDSAGANLAAAVSLMARDKKEFEVSKQILLYPATYYDHTENSPFASIRENGKDFLLTAKRIKQYITLYKQKEEDLKNPYFAPLLAATGENQPQTLLITAEFDPLRDEGEAYGQKLKEAGNEVEIYRLKDAIHGFFSNALEIKSTKECYQILTTFLKVNK